MSNQIRQFISKFKDHNFRLLWAEGAVQSVMIGAGFYSLPLVIILLAALMWVLQTRWEAIYLIAIFSCVWGLLAGWLGYSLNGWALALLFSVLALRSGVK